MDVRGKCKRKRRRRCNRGSSSWEVKDNDGNKIPADCHLLQKYHPSTFCATPPRRGSRGLKRKQQLLDNTEPLLCQSHPTYRRATWAVTQKNALVHLNELRPGLRYELVSKTGPLHAPVFSIGVEVNGLHFEGQGPTKKLAKMRAAEMALQSFIQFPNASQAQATLGNLSGTAEDFTADKLDNTGVFLKDTEPLHHSNPAKKEVFSSTYNHRRLVQLTLDLVSSAGSKRTFRTSLLEHLSPVVLLNELRPGLRYICLTERVHGRPTRRFVMVVRMEGRVFEGCSHSKRLAKAQAAAAALHTLYNINVGPERNVPHLQGGTATFQLPQFFAESIFHLVTQKYRELTDGCFTTSNCHHKVLAGIVMTRGFDLTSAEVVSLATGTKCLDSDSIYDSDCTVSDCHAEVVCRRAMVRFLYTQLELLLRTSAGVDQPSILVPNEGRGGFRLQDGVLFHMYISSSPCGDARLNCPYETSATCPSKRFHCRLRVKADGGEGTLPVTAHRANEKRDSVSPGKRLTTMSCTDKIAKWGVVGLQGALLSHLLEPLYLHSLTVGTLSHTGHLGRALAHRLMSVKHLPLPYRRQRLLLGCLSSSESRPAGKAQSISVNWSSGDGGLEEINTSTGRRRDSGTASRLSRRCSMARWQRLQTQINGQIAGAGDTFRTYASSKMAARQYQRAMLQFTTALQSSGLGTWIRKHPE